MNWFRNLRIGRKLALGFGFTTLLSLAVGGFALLQMGRMHDDTMRIANDRMPSVRLVAAMEQALLRLRTLELQHLLAMTQEGKSQTDKAIGDAQREFDAADQRLVPLITGEEEHALHQRLLAQMKTYLAVHARVVALSRDRHDDEALELSRTESLAARNAVAAAMEALVRHDAEGADAEARHAADTYAMAMVLIVALSVLATLLGTGMGLAITRLITRPVREAVEVTRRVAAGDLSVAIESGSGDETGQLLAALAEMNASLRRIVGDVRAGTELIGTASREIAAGNQDLSQRTEEQASSLEETASSMEELTGTVRQNADNARQASQLAASASAVAVRGGSVVGEVVTTMGAITDSSRRIADIIGVIDGIAFQTNILALNAAVEAARAGEQGRGFAVVAGEVRNLAQRSAAAAKEIKSLIDDSVAKVGTGAKQVEAAGATMTEVVASIQRVTDIMAEITAASQEQSSGIEQVNRAVMQMDQVTQQNAALVEQAAAAAESMQEQAQVLAGAVSVFKLPGAGMSTAASAASPAIHRADHAAMARSSLGARTSVAWPQVERRGPDRARNVSRLPPRRDADPAPSVAAAPARAPAAAALGSGADSDWAEF